MKLVVVGGSSGIGRTLGVSLAQRGATVAFLARRQDRIDKAAAEAGNDSIAVTCDVTDEESCRRAVDEAAGQLAGFDALIYATGIGALARIEDTSADVWRRLFDTNVIGASLVTTAALPHLKQSGGKAVYLSSLSVSHLLPMPGLGAYSVSKVALERLIDAWRGEHPEIGFTRVVVGDTTGGEGDNASQFAANWEMGLAAELMPVWMSRNYIDTALIEVEEIVHLVDAVLRAGASAAIPAVTIAPRKSPEGIAAYERAQAQYQGAL